MDKSVIIDVDSADIDINYNRHNDHSPSEFCIGENSFDTDMFQKVMKNHNFKIYSVRFKDISEKDFYKFKEKTIESDIEFFNDIIFRHSNIMWLKFWRANSNNKCGLQLIWNSSKMAEPIELINDLKNCIFEDPILKIKMLVPKGQSIGWDNFEFSNPKIDIINNYGNDFERKHKKILSKLDGNADWDDEDASWGITSGLIVFNGPPGTGKTMYIRHICNVARKQRRDVAFVPSNLSGRLSSPEFIPLLKELKDPLIVIEDVDNLIRSREESNGIVDVILNVTDGIMADVIKAQILLTYNMDSTKVDAALLRKGRLLIQHEFRKLTPEEATKVSKIIHGEDGPEFDEDTPLCDIYNLDENFAKTEPKRNKIGFGA